MRHRVCYQQKAEQILSGDVGQTRQTLAKGDGTYSQKHGEYMRTTGGLSGVRITYNLGFDFYDLLRE